MLSKNQNTYTLVNKLKWLTKDIRTLAMLIVKTALQCINFTQRQDKYSYKKLVKNAEKQHHIEQQCNLIIDQCDIHDIVVLLWDEESFYITIKSNIENLISRCNEQKREQLIKFFEVYLHKIDKRKNEISDRIQAYVPHSIPEAMTEDSGVVQTQETDECSPTKNDQQQPALLPQQTSEPLTARQSNPVGMNDADDCSTLQTEQGLLPDVSVPEVQSSTEGPDTNNVSKSQETSPFPVVVPASVALTADLHKVARQGHNYAAAPAIVHKKYQAGDKKREFNLSPVATALNTEAPLRLNEKPQFRTFELDLNYYLNSAEVVIISGHPVMEKLKKIIRNCGDFNCFHSAHEDLGGMVALLWTMALLSRPFQYANGKPVEQQSFLLLDICAIQPLKVGGRCCNLNMMIVPELIVKRNNTVIPASQSESAFCGESTRIARREPYSGSNFFRKIANARSLWDLDQFLIYAAQILNRPLAVTTEPDRTPLPYFSLLEHEFSALPAWQIFCPALKDLKTLFMDSTGMLEAAALVIFDAATMGNPDSIINQLLSASTNALHTRQENEPDALQHKHNVINLINGLMKQRFKHNVVDFPAKFEESLYCSLFSQTPLPLIW